MKRRDAIRSLVVLPVAGVAAGTVLPFGSLLASPAAPPSPKRDLFKELGIRTFINAAGTYTFMSGCLMHEEVVDAIRSTAHQFAMIDEVQDKVGEKIAAMCMQRLRPSLQGVGRHLYWARLVSLLVWT